MMDLAQLWQAWPIAGPWHLSPLSAGTNNLVWRVEAADAPQSFRESYRIEPLDTRTCRVHFTTEIGGVPKVAEFFMRQALEKAQPQIVARIKSVLAAR